MKKVNIGAKPTGAARSVDDWVKDRGVGAGEATGEQEPKEPMKRLTIDVPASLHTRIKSQCAGRGKVMADEIRALLETEFPEG